MIEIGNEGLKKARLIINQGCSLNFSVVHKDANNAVVDHSGSHGYIALQRGKSTYKFANAVTCGAENITVNITPSETRSIPPNDYNWDFIVEMQGDETVRLIYGEASVIDTYALD